jgi:glutamate 5-kinase
VATKEIAVGDNDTLGAIVAGCAKADLLVLLSDINGLYTADPKSDPSAVLIERVEDLTPELYALAGKKGSDLATGGMITKLHAAEIALSAGVEMIIYNGSYPECLYDIVEGKPIGTRFCVKGKKV